MASAQQRPLAVDIVIYDGTDELDFVAPFEVIDAARSSFSGISVRLVTTPAPNQTQVKCSHGMVVVPHGVLGDRPVDIVIVPGGGWAAKAPIGTYAQYVDGDIPKILQSMHADAGGKTIFASVCTGAMLLSKAGLLKGRRATTHHAAFDDLENDGAIVMRGARVVDDGDLITGGGVTSGLDVGLKILERFYGTTVRDQIATRLEYHPPQPSS